MRPHRTATAILCLTSIACATTKRPETVWRNTVDENRNYVRDSQECQIIARALVPSGISPMLTLVFYQTEWSRCMNGRDWYEVAASSIAKPAGPSLPSETTQNSRWMITSRHTDYTTYLDTSRIEREGGSSFAIWTRTDYASPQQDGAHRYWRLVARENYDCAAQRTRITNIALYGQKGEVLTMTQNPDMSWINPAPETHSEAMLRTLCPLYLRSPLRNK